MSIKILREPIPILIIFTIIAFCSGRGLDLLTQGPFKWIMLIGLIIIISSIISIFDDPFSKVITKLKIGLLILFIGGAGQAYFFPDPESYDQSEVVQQRLHRTDFSDSMTKRIQREDEAFRIDK